MCFVRVIKELDAEQRMSMVVKWYLGCIRACQLEMMAARKPLNPVQGETFKCIWNLKDGNVIECHWTLTLASINFCVSFLQMSVVIFWFSGL